MDQPSEAELRLLKLFWDRGPLSAREAHDALPPELGWAPSTTRTMLERLRQKALLRRRSSHGLAIYEPAQARAAVLGAVLKRTLRDLLEVEGRLPAAAFSGSRILSEAELDEVARLLNEPGE